ncbi:MAG: glycosyltransferase family 4 protein [Candidatus Omnitrophica bacterium]|nr:glycosyltransferase family 4 protein [Candidatus Omnitrophota bacterium]
MSRINLLYVITKLELGGAQTQLLALIKSLDQDKFRPFLFTAAEGFLLADFSSLNGLTLVKSRCLERNINPLKDLCAVIEIYRFIKKNNIDIVHTHSSKAGIIGRCAARLAGARVIIHSVHGWSFNDFQAPWKKMLFTWLERRAAGACDALVVVSEHDRQKGMSLRIGSREKYRLIRYGISWPGLQEGSREGARKALGIPADAVVIGTVSCLKPQKSPVGFVRLAQALHARFPQARFLLVGDGILRKKVERLAQKGHLEKALYLCGWQRDIPRILSAMDIFVLTSLWEGLPIAVLEAMAASLPVVATDTGGIKEVVSDGESGFLVGPRRIDMMEARIAPLVEDAALRRRLGERARLRIGDGLSTGRMVSDTQNLYKELIKKEGGLC